MKVLDEEEEDDEESDIKHMNAAEGIVRRVLSWGGWAKWCGELLFPFSSNEAAAKTPVPIQLLLATSMLYHRLASHIIQGYVISS